MRKLQQRRGKYINLFAQSSFARKLKTVKNSLFYGIFTFSKITYFPLFKDWKSQKNVLCKN